MNEELRVIKEELELAREERAELNRTLVRVLASQQEEVRLLKKSFTTSIERPSFELQSWRQGLLQTLRNSAG